MSAPTDRETAAHVLWHYTGSEFPEAYRPGSFYEALQSAIAKADIVNRDRLLLVFRHQVVLAMLAEHVPDGIDLLRQLARGEEAMVKAEQAVLAVILAETEASERG